MFKTITPIDNSVYVERGYASSKDIEKFQNLLRDARRIHILHGY